MMPLMFDADAPDDAFLAAFESADVSADAWTHKCHIRMAWIYLRRFTFDEALANVRAGIQKLNAGHHVPDAIDRGYHETVTHAWMRIVQATMHHHGAGEDSLGFCTAQPHLLSGRLLRLYYTKARILTAN